MLGVRTLIAVHRTELLYQWESRLMSSLLLERVGKIGDGHYTESDITVAMVQTTANKKPEREYDCIILDEAHHAPADTFYKLAEGIKAKYRFGLSATPFREDNAEAKIWAMVGQIQETISVEQLTEQGFLAKQKWEYLKMKKHFFKGDWQTNLKLACEDEENNIILARRAWELAKDGHFVYVDVRLINHGKLFTEIFNSFSSTITAKFIYGSDSTKKRQRVLAEFKQGGVVLVSTLIKEGVDLPEMSTIILAGPARSTGENIQKIGRALRPKPGTNEAIVIDRFDKSSFLNGWFEMRQKTLKAYYGRLFTSYKDSKQKNTQVE